jgi:Flp pilus assembly pilin Flp
VKYKRRLNSDAQHSACAERRTCTDRVWDGQRRKASVEKGTVMRRAYTLRHTLLRERRGFTRLEVGLLTAMLGAMVINGIVTLGGGLGTSYRPIGMTDTTGMSSAAIGPRIMIRRASTMKVRGRSSATRTIEVMGSKIHCWEGPLAAGL